jgi:hypothetical protein
LARYLQLTAKAKTGLSAAVAVFAIVAAVAAVVTLGFALFAIFIWLAERYSALTAALVLAGFFLGLAILAAIAALVAQRRTIANARQALQARSNAPWLNPNMLAVALQIGRTIGMRKIVSMLAVGVLAAMVAKEWAGRDEPEPGGTDSDGD